jgi:hypothetical protein
MEAKGQVELIKQIGEAERQLKSAKDSMEKCLISLQCQIRDLENNVMLQEIGAVGETLSDVGTTALFGAALVSTGALLAGPLSGKSMSCTIDNVCTYYLNSPPLIIQHPLSK